MNKRQQQAEQSRKKIYDAAERLFARHGYRSVTIEEICREPLCFEQILQRLFARYALTMTYEQYVLVGSTVRSYLAWLKDTGRVEGRFEDNLLRWQRI